MRRIFAVVLFAVLSEPVLAAGADEVMQQRALEQSTYNQLGQQQQRDRQQQQLKKRKQPAPRGFGKQCRQCLGKSGDR
jgi:hypothetical protein